MVAGIVQPGIELAGTHAQHGGDGGVLGGIVRQPVGLGIFLVLQRVLGATQQAPGRQQLFHIGLVQQPAARQPLQGLRGAALAQGRILPATHDLEHLGAELDLADAATPQLHVEAGVVAAGAPALGLAGLGADHVVQLGQRGERRKIQIGTEHEGHHLLHQLLFVAACAVEGGQARVGNHPTLEPGKALPFAPLLVEIAAQGGQGGDQRAHVAVGAQPGVHAEDEAVGRDVGEQLAQPAGNALQVARFLARVPCHVDQVDVGRDVQLAAAQLAHAHHQHVLRTAAAVQQGAPLFLQLGGGHLQGMAHGDLGPVGDGAQHFFQRGLAAHVAFDEGHHQQVAEAPQGDFGGLAQHLVAHPGLVDGHGGERDADEGVQAGEAAFGAGADGLQVAAEEGAVAVGGVVCHGGIGSFNGCKRSTTRGLGTYPYRGEGMRRWVLPLRGHENLESGA